MPPFRFCGLLLHKIDVLIHHLLEVPAELFQLEHGCPAAALFVLGKPVEVEREVEALAVE